MCFHDSVIFGIFNFLCFFPPFSLCVENAMPLEAGSKAMTNVTLVFSSTLYTLVVLPNSDSQSHIKNANQNIKLSYSLSSKHNHDPTVGHTPQSQESQHLTSGLAADRATREWSHRPLLLFLSAQGYPVSHLQIQNAVTEGFSYLCFRLVHLYLSLRENWL